MNRNSAGFVVSETFPDEAASEALGMLRERLHCRLSHVKRITGTFHGEDYLRKLLTGVRPISLDFFIELLRVVERLGRQDGREWVRRILDVIARPFGLEVVPRSDHPTKDLGTEVTEANSEIHRAFATVDDVRRGKAQPADAKAAICRAMIELDDVAEAVGER